MKLHSPKFEAALKQRVNAANPPHLDLRARFERARVIIVNLSASGIGQLVVSVFLLGSIFLAWKNTRELESCLLTLNLWLFFSVIFFGIYLTSIPRTSKELKIFGYYPIGLEDIYRWERDKALLSSLIILFHALVGYGVISYLFGFSAIQCVLIGLLSVVSWLVCLLLSVVSIRFIPPRSYLAISITGALALIYHLSELVKPERTHLLPTQENVCLVQLNLLLPTGWLVSSVHSILLDSEAFRGFLVVPLLLGLMALNISNYLKPFRKSLDYLEPTFETLSEPFDIIPGTEVLNPKLRILRGIKLEGHSIEEGILSGEFLKRIEWDSGLAGIAWKWLSERQKTLAEFAFSRPPIMFLVWRSILYFSLLFSSLSILVFQYNVELSQALFKVGIIPSVGILIINLANLGSMFSFKNFGNNCMPYHAFFPIEFDNTYRMFIKIGAVRIPLFTMYSIALVQCAGFSFKVDFVEAVVMFIQCHADVFLFICVFVSVAKINSYTTGFNFRMWGKSTVILLLYMGIALVFVSTYAFATPNLLILQVLSPICTIACGCLLLWSASKVPQNTEWDMIRPADPKAEIRAKQAFNLNR